MREAGVYHAEEERWEVFGILHPSASRHAAPHSGGHYRLAGQQLLGHAPQPIAASKIGDAPPCLVLCQQRRPEPLQLLDAARCARCPNLLSVLPHGGGQCWLRSRSFDNDEEEEKG